MLSKLRTSWSIFEIRSEKVLFLVQSLTRFAGQNISVCLFVGPKRKPKPVRNKEYTFPNLELLHHLNSHICIRLIYPWDEKNLGSHPPTNQCLIDSRQTQRPLNCELIDHMILPYLFCGQNIVTTVFQGLLCHKSKYRHIPSKRMTHISACTPSLQLMSQHTLIAYERLISPHG